MNRVVVAVVCVLAGAGCKKLGAKVKQLRTAHDAAWDPAVADEPIPIVVPTGPGLAPGRYKLVSLIIEAQPTTASHTRWDPADQPAPELRGTLTLDGNDLVTCSSTESVVAICQFDAEVEIRADSVLALAVVDRDAVIDDPIGSATLRDPSHWGTRIDLPFQPAGRVRSATVRLADAPSWWALRRWSLIGLAIGVTAALGALGLFSGRLLPRAPVSAPPPPPPRCAHCNGLVATTDPTCSHCGAKL